MIRYRSHSFLQFQLPFLAWCVFIFTVSSIPQARIPNFVNYTDKMVHAGVYFTLCWLAHVAFRFQPAVFLRTHALLLAWVFVVLFGISDEYHQMFTPGRTSEVLDLAADAAGGFLYVLFYRRFRFYDRYILTR